jgi:hypothetical protein
MARLAGNSRLDPSSPAISVTVHPPAYAGAPAATRTNPERLEVLEGSRLQFALTRGAPARLRFGGREVGVLAPNGHALETVALESGYFAIESRDGDSGEARLISLSVTRDRAPTVTIEKPARDLLLPPDPARLVPIQISAADDLGLASLELRYTKVSGSGEQFEFQEGVVPLRVTRGSGRDWRATADLPVGALTAGAGDSLVYRAVARDARPGDAGAGTSDTFFVEIAGPGQVPLEGIEMPPDEERYALSQQMIVLKIERLRAREQTLPREALVEEAGLLAAEQRTVRANFIFLLGGHVEDEEEEAEQSHEIAEGRLQNTARREINAAIGLMTRAEQGLVAGDTGRALPPARGAVEALQRAFGRSRYLLRALASRTALDPGRRLTGNVGAAGDWRRSLAEPDPRAGAKVRELLDDLITAYDGIGGVTTAVQLGALAERVLALDPGSPRWHAAARQVQGAARQLSSAAEARQLLEGVIAELAGEAGVGLVPAAPINDPASALERAWRNGGRR